MRDLSDGYLSERQARGLKHAVNANIPTHVYTQRFNRRYGMVGHLYQPGKAQ